MTVPQFIKDQIDAYNTEKKRIDAMREALDDRMKPLMDPVLETSDLDLFREMQDLVYHHTYWQSELRRRIHALKKLTPKERAGYEKDIDWQVLSEIEISDQSDP